MPKKQPNKQPSLELELTFEGDEVQSSWYHPDLAEVLCTLCGKGCTKVKCVMVNPYCG